MQIIRSEEGQSIVNGSAHVMEYDFGDPDIDVARIAVKGRYPAKGRVMNEKSKECCYIIEGKGSIYVEGDETSFTTGDVLLIQPGERFYWEADMIMLVPSTPAWKIEQHKEVE